MAELIAKIILGGSMVGIGTILIKKIPLLKETPEIEIKKIDGKSLIEKITDWIKGFASFSSNLIFQKILSRIRIFTLIFERKVENKIQRLREEAKRMSLRKKDNYWKKIKEAKEKKDNNSPE